MTTSYYAIDIFRHKKLAAITKPLPIVRFVKITKKFCYCLRKNFLGDKPCKIDFWGTNFQALMVTGPTVKFKMFFR